MIPNIDIPELDDTVMRMRAEWKKANNYFHTFANHYLKVKAEFESGRYGSEISFERWLGSKCGMSRKFTEKMILLHCNALASFDREKLELEKKQRTAAQRQERQERSRAAAQHRQERQAERASQPNMSEPESAWEAAMRKEAREIAAMRPRRAVL